MPVPGALAVTALGRQGVQGIACTARTKSKARHTCLTSGLLLPPQVFEYLSTDLKKWMDRNGKGPAHPLPKQIIKVQLHLLGWVSGMHVSEVPTCLLALHAQQHAYTRPLHTHL